MYDAVIRPVRAVVMPQQMLRLSNPLSCLMCCRALPDGDPIERLWLHFSRYMPLEAKMSDEPVLRRQPPDYVRRLLEGRRADAVVGESPIEHPPSGAILIFDLREEVEDPFRNAREAGWDAGL